MKLKISKSQWEKIGRQANWYKTAQYNNERDIKDAIEEGLLVLIEEEGNRETYMDDIRNSKVIVEYKMVFHYKNDPGAGFSFDCDKNGKILTGKLLPTGKKNLDYIMRNLNQFSPPKKESKIKIEVEKLQDMLKEPNYTEEMVEAKNNRKIKISESKNK